MDKHERLMEARMARRLAAEDRFLTRLEKRERAAEPLIGELSRNGETVYYINVRSKDGKPTGKIREFADHGSALVFLLRNNYV